MITRAANEPGSSPSAGDETAKVAAYPVGHDAQAYPGLDVMPGPHAGTPRAMMQSAKDEYKDLSLRVVAGALPPDLFGHMYVAGPRVHAGSQALASDGIVYRLDFDQGAAKLTSGVMRSESTYAADAIASGRYYSKWWGRTRAAFRSITYGKMSLTLGMVDAPNTAPVALPNGLLIITTDAGRPYIIDPKTLRAISPVGASSEWKPALPFPWAFPLLQTTAHPAVDPETGELFMTNHAPRVSVFIKPFVHLVRWSKDDERLHHFRLIDGETGDPLDAQTIHQIAVTRDYVVLLNSDFKVNFGTAFAELMTPWIPHLGRLIEKWTVGPSNPNAVVWVVARKDLLPRVRGIESDEPPTAIAYRFEAGAGALHFAVNFENPDNVIHLVAAHSPTEDLTHTISAGEMLMNGRRASPDEDGMCTAVPGVISSMGIHRIDMNTRLVESRQHSDERYTWGLTVYNNAGFFQGELQGQQWVYLNSDGFTADLMPVEIFELYKDRIGSARNLPIRDGRAASFFRFGIDSGEFQGWRLPAGWFSFAPTFVPSNARPDEKLPEGYLVGFVISDPTPQLPEGSSGDEIWIFDAQDIGRGPICRLSAPDLQIGMSLHSFWLPTFPEVTSDYRIDMREDMNVDRIEADYLEWLQKTTGWPAWACLPYQWAIRLLVDFPELRRLFESEIYPNFPRR